MTTGTSLGASAPTDEAAGYSARPLWGLLLPLLVLGASVAAVAPFAGIRLEQQPAFVPVMMALVVCFNVLSVVLLVGQFRDTGDPRALALSWAYVFSLVMLLGQTAALPGVFGSWAPLGAVPSSALRLWALWHTGFAVFLAVALAPWPRAFGRRVAAGRRARLAWVTVTGAAAGGGLLVAVVVALADRLPVLIQGTDITAMAGHAGPAILPVVVAATIITIVGAFRGGGAERWAGLAAAASLGNVALTLSSHHRFTVGWYAGRTLTIVSAAVVLIALLAEFSAIKRRLALEGERLRTALDHTERLERLQHTLLGHLADGVLMHDRAGELVASNPAARSLLRLNTDQLSSRAALDPRWRRVLPNGGAWEASNSPTMTTLRTGVEQRDKIVGVQTGDGQPRWLSVNTAVVRDPAGSIDFVVSSMNDVTNRHAARLAADQDRRDRRARIQQVLDDGGPTMVFQPIVELATGKPVGAEALARFPVPPPRPPDEWFADAADVGLAVELELSAIRAALSQLDSLPAGTYLSLNAGPDTVLSPALNQLLRSASADRIVLELTEHTGVADYTALSDALDALRSAGVRLAVDDAGAGYSSLQHILNLRPEIIKLDRGLIENLDTDPARRALAGSLMTFANEIGAQVVAEGIENLREQTVLRRLGIRYGQGFHLGRPGPLPLPEGGPIPTARLVMANGH